MSKNVQWHPIEYTLKGGVLIPRNEPPPCIVCGEPSVITICPNEHYCAEDYEERKRQLLSGEASLPSGCYLVNLTPDEVNAYNVRFEPRDVTEEMVREARQNGLCPCPVCGQTIFRIEACNHMTHVHYIIQENPDQPGRFIFNVQESVEYCDNCCRRITMREGTWRDADNPNTHHYLRNGAGYEDVAGPCIYSAGVNNERDVVLQMVRENGLTLQQAIDFQNDRDIVLAAVNQNGLALRFAHNDMKRDVSIVWEAARQNGLALQYAPRDTQLIVNQLPRLIEMLQQDGLQLQMMPRLNNIDVIVMTAVEHNGLALQYAHNNMKGQDDIVWEAVSQNGLALQYANDDMKNNDEIVLEAVSQNGLALQYAHENMKNNRDIVSEAVRQNGLALQYANDDMKRDRDIVLDAVKQNGLALQYASDGLKRHRTIVMYAVQQNGLALQYAHDNLRRTRGIVEDAVQQNEAALRYALIAVQNVAVGQPNNIIRNRAEALNAVRQNGLALQNVHDDFKNDYDIVKEAVKQNGLALQYASEGMRRMRPIVVAAVRQNNMAREFSLLGVQGHV